MAYPFQSYILVAVAVLGVAFISYSMSMIRTVVRNGSHARISRSPPVHSEEQSSPIIVRTVVNDTLHKSGKPHLREEKPVIMATVCFFGLFSSSRN